MAKAVLELAAIFCPVASSEILCVRLHVQIWNPHLLSTHSPRHCWQDGAFAAVGSAEDLCVIEDVGLSLISDNQGQGAQSYSLKPHALVFQNVTWRQFLDSSNPSL